jgi:hypothetical protein
MPYDNQLSEQMKNIIPPGALLSEKISIGLLEKNGRFSKFRRQNPALGEENDGEMKNFRASSSFLAIEPSPARRGHDRYRSVCKLDPRSRKARTRPG